MESSSSRKYGLIVPKKKLDGVMKISNVFGDDSDSDSGMKKKPIQTSNRTKAQQRSAKIAIDKALEEDATVFQYDEVYDDMEKKKEQLDGRKKKEVDKKPRYIQNLLVQAEKRKIEYERRNERIIQKEREAEGDEFKDKEAFVTSSYKKKLEEMKKMDEEDLKLSMIEDINDVTKQRDMGSFYRHLYKKELCDDENKDEAAEMKKPVQKSDTSRQYRKRASSNSSNGSADDDKDTDLSDSSLSESSPKRSKVENTDKSGSEEGEILEKSKVAEENVSNNEPKLELKENTEVETPKDNKTKQKESEPKKEVVPKINIWKKRTVGDVYEAARQRYFERKMKQINLHARS